MTQTRRYFLQGEAKDAFVIFDEAYEGNDVDAFYLGDILRALGCTLTNKSVVELGGATELGKFEKKQLFIVGSLT